MNKVYVVGSREDEYGGFFIEGIFSEENKDKANWLTDNNYGYEIEEWNVDELVGYLGTQVYTIAFNYWGAHRWGGYSHYTGEPIEENILSTEFEKWNDRSEDFDNPTPKSFLNVFIRNVIASSEEEAIEKANKVKEEWERLCSE